VSVNHIFLIMLVMIICPSTVKADGGVVRTTQTEGIFIITVFTPPEISRDVPAEVAIMIQKHDTGEVVMDAEVGMSFIPPISTASQSNEPSMIRATRASPSNKLLYGTATVFPLVGDWQMRVSIRQGRESAVVNCILPVGMPPRRLTGLWLYLALPPLVIALFIMNQWLRR
jgi:hypothetical protein